MSENVFHKMFCSSDLMAKVSEFVQTEAGNEKLSLYCFKERTSHSAYSNIIQIILINFSSFSASPEEEEFLKEIERVDGFQPIGTLPKEACQLVALDETQLIEYKRTVKENERAERQTYDVFDNSDPSSDDEGAFGGMFGN